MTTHIYKIFHFLSLSINAGQMLLKHSLRTLSAYEVYTCHISLLHMTTFEKAYRCNREALSKITSESIKKNYCCDTVDENNR